MRCLETQKFGQGRFPIGILRHRVRSEFVARNARRDARASGIAMRAQDSIAIGTLTAINKNSMCDFLAKPSLLHDAPQRN